jgi:tetratricopeptide (TPR) repeat protein
MAGVSRPIRSDSGRDGRAFARGYLLAALAAALLYLPTIRYGFAYDDTIVVETHPQVTGHLWREMLVSPYHVGKDVRVPTGIYRPLTIATLAANHAATGLHAWSYHLVNVLLHVAATVLALAFGRAIGLGPVAAGVGALAFAVHPVHVEAVANVAGRAELLSTALGLAALVVYARSRSAGGRFPARAALAFGSLLGLAAFAKENAVTLVGVVVLFEAQHVRRLRDAALPVTAAIAPVALYLAARLAVLGGFQLAPGAVTPIENPIVGLTGLPRVATLLGVFGRAASLLLTPVRLSPDYGYAEITPWTTLLSPGPLVGAAILLGLALAVVSSWRRAPRVAFLLASSLVTYSIVSNALIVIGTVLGDRLLYLPSAFVCLLGGVAAAAAAARFGRAPAYSAAGAILVLFTIRSGLYASRWKDDATLFAYAARVAPASVRNTGSWAVLLAERGRLDEARALLDRVVAIAPDFVPNRLNRGAAALAAGDLDAAEADARRVLELDPDNREARRLQEAVARRRTATSEPPAGGERG